MHEKAKICLYIEPSNSHRYGNIYRYNIHINKKTFEKITDLLGRRPSLL